MNSPDQCDGVRGKRTRLLLRQEKISRQNASGAGSVSATGSSDSDDSSKLKKMKPHVPGIVIFADHNRPLPWSVTYHAVTLFADISGFTALCEKYSTMGQSGVDQLTRTLNEYLSVLVEGILASDGDILKFAGDAILAIWRVGRVEELQSEIVKVVRCCLAIQDMCGEWDTDIGVSLTVKIGVAAGEMSVTFLGNREYRHYVELGPAISAVNTAEHFCQSGMIVISPDTWEHCDQSLFELEPVEDLKHMRVIGIVPAKRTRSYSLPTPQLMPFSQLQERRLSDDGTLEDVKSFRKSHLTRMANLPTIESSVVIPKPKESTAPKIELTQVEENDPGESSDTPRQQKNMKSMVRNKMSIGAKFGKLKKLVTTVTEMKLDIALRLYILSPVLKKIDDNQPLEYLSEMRQVSILFMNLVLDETVRDDTEQNEQLLQKIFELVYLKTKAMHGALNKVFLFDKGCTFLVIFGLPGYKHENDCAHALACSGRMKCQLDNTAGVERVSIGVTTGTTFCGVVGHNQRHEYSVIGRKVNMAARLMMNYPDKITCDVDTYQTCRLPPSFFEVLMTKRMKGLRNVGVIRQFVGYSKDEKMVAKSIMHSDYPILGRQMEDFIFREQLKVMRREENKRRHLVFSGPSGIGKTKVLDQALFVAGQETFNTISCRVEMEDSSYPHFVSNHVLRCMLSNKGYSDQIDREPYLVDAIGEDSVYLYVLNDVLGTQIEKPVSLVGEKVDEKAKRKSLFRKIAVECLDTEGTVVVIDDAHNIDTSSWAFLCELLPLKHCFIVLSIRPTILDVPSCPETLYFLKHTEVKVIDLSALDLKYVAPLACQMMNVCSIPKDIDRLLRERSHGVPSWCLEILRDMLEQKQLIIVHDDGRKEYKQSSIAPNKALITTAAAMHMLSVPSDARVHQLQNFSITELADDDIESSAKDLLSGLGFDTEPQPNADSSRRLSMLVPSKELLGGKKGGYSQPRQISRIEMARIAIFAKGIDADDLPVPVSMKELIVARIDTMRATDQLLIKCAAVLGTVVRRDILEILLPKAHRPKLAGTICRLMESGIFTCSQSPPSRATVKKGTNDEHRMQKYKCFCHRSVSETSTIETNACNEPMFTHQLLQETAYEVLMESQRNELHTKAAQYLELSADELRGHVPYYLLFRPPADDIEEQSKLIELKLADVDAVISLRRKSLDSKEEKPRNFAIDAMESRSKRGRRHAVLVSSNEAFQLIGEIAEGGKPLQPTCVYIQKLLPIYASLIHHWRCINKTKNALSTLAEAIAAALVIDCQEQALEFVHTALDMLDGIKKDSPHLDKNQKLIFARIHRLHGQIMYHIGDVKNAYRLMPVAASYLGLKESKQPIVSAVRNLWLIIKFFWCWRFRTQQSECLDVSVLEQGYLFAELFRMDKEQGHTNSKIAHAVKLFTTINSGRAHIHQVVDAYSAMIECSRERGWTPTCEALQWDLLRICAKRNDELSTYDRTILSEIYGTSCIELFLQGNLEKAKVVGKAAADICTCVRDVKKTKMLCVYYFYLCLFRNVYQESIALLGVMRGNAQLLPDGADIRALYQVTCVEIALIGGNPPENIQTCISCLRNYLHGNNEAVQRSSQKYYFGMTIALWFARCEKWSESQIWFDNALMFEGRESSYYSLMGDAHRLQCLLITKALKPEEDKCLQENVKRVFKKALKQVKNAPVLRPRFFHLKAYFGVVLRENSKANTFAKKALKVCASHGNVLEERWLNSNLKVWFDKENGGEESSNEEWKEYSEDCGGHWNPSEVPELIMYNLPVNKR